MNKIKPTVERITFSKEDQADIKNILEGKPKNKDIQRLKEKGWDVEAWINRRRRISQEYRIKRLKQEYYHGVCHQCGKLPNWKLIFNMDDASVIERYCSSCLPREFS